MAAPEFVHVVQGQHFGDELYVFDSDEAAEAFVEARGVDRDEVIITEEPVLDAAFVASVRALDS